MKARIIADWAARILVAVPFLIAAGLEGLSSPADLVAMDLVWIPGAPLWLVRGIALVEAIAAVGLILPGLTRLPGRLVTVSAVALLIVQVSAFGFDLAQGAVDQLAVKTIIMALTISILWVRR